MSTRSEQKLNYLISQTEVASVPCDGSNPTGPTTHHLAWSLFLDKYDTFEFVQKFNELNLEIEGFSGVSP